MPESLKDWLFLIAVGFIFLFPSLSDAASSERLRDQVDRLKEAGPTVYCANVAEFWDDGTWAASMGIADAIFPRPEGEAVDPDPDRLPRDGIRHQDWAKMTTRERDWYADLFHAGYKVGRQFMVEHAEVLISDPHDFSGHIPLGFRTQMKQWRFEQCMEQWHFLES